MYEMEWTRTPELPQAFPGSFEERKVEEVCRQEGTGA
jgi:hypothetical protein